MLMTTVMTVLPSPGVRVTAESLIHDLGRVSEWYDLWGMKLNASKTKAMIVSRSPPLTIGRTVLKESDNRVILGVTFDSKLTFEKHLRLVSRAASQRLGILRKSRRVFDDRSLLERCFRGFVLPVLEYCSAVWCSAVHTHLKLLDRAVSGALFLAGVCLSVTLIIVDLLQFCIYCIRSGVTRCTLLMMPYLDRMCQCRLHAVLWSHIGILMHRLAVPQDFCSPVSVPVERSCRPRIRWCGTGGIQEQGKFLFIGLSSSIPTIVFYYFSPSLLSVYRLVLCGWGLWTDRAYITLSQSCTADLF